MIKEQVLKMFMDNKTAYEIYVNTGLSFAEITHYIRQDEEARHRHQVQLRANREMI